MENEIKIIAIPVSDSKAIVKVLLDWINTSCDIIDTPVVFNHLDESNSGITLVPLDGAKITKKFMFGNYKAQFPFAIVARTVNSDSQDKSDVCDSINNLGDWFDIMTRGKTFPTLGNKRIILGIEQVSMSTPVYRNKSGVEDYQGKFLLKFEKEV